jgi:peptidoglycan/xylan/chitin deacetylase (PgdA/CDA1 family)
MTDRLSYLHRRRGLDHTWFPHAPTIQRPPISWPSGERIALWITVPVEFFPLDAAAQPFRPLGAPPSVYPDLWNYSSRDYGLRIGIYRIMRVLGSFGLRASAAVNAEIAVRYPRVIDEIAKRGWEFVANGQDMGHIHHGGLLVEDERRLIRTARATLAKACGCPVNGWHSPGRSHSRNTLALLAEQGFTYVTDWANDDMPYWVTTPCGQLCAMPLTYEWSDRHLLVQHNLTVEDYIEQTLRALDRLIVEAEQYGSGRVLSLSITPWILGYPHRIAALQRLLHEVLNKRSVWPATGAEIVGVFTEQAMLEPQR